jgi:hypothetical protein
VRRSLSLSCAGAMLAAVGVAAAPRAATIASEIARIRAEAPSTVPADSKEAVDFRLRRAANAAGAGRAFLALYELQPAWETQSAWAFASASASAVKTEAQFADKWKAIGEPKIVPAPGTRPLFVEALAQSSEGKAVATYRASLPYSQDVGITAGLYYLGESQAFGKFAAFCRSMPMETPVRQPALRSLDAELTTLEADVLKAYETAQGDARQPFIAISVTLKLARQLDQQGRRPGALLQYLLARYRFALTHPAKDPAQLPARLAAARTFNGREADHSIAFFLLQVAEANMDTGADPGPRVSSAVIDDVLPAYWAVIK